MGFRHDGITISVCAGERCSVSFANWYMSALHMLSVSDPFSSEVCGRCGSEAREPLSRGCSRTQRAATVVHRHVRGRYRTQHRAVACIRHIIRPESVSENDDDVFKGHHNDSGVLACNRIHGESCGTLMTGCAYVGTTPQHKHDRSTVFTGPSQWSTMNVRPTCNCSRILAHHAKPPVCAAVGVHAARDCRSWRERIANVR
jgi:hypothetical protein